MQAYEVEFLPAQLSPLHVKDGLRARLHPVPHVAVGDLDTPGRGVRIPLTARLAAALNGNGGLIATAKAFRDPKSGRIVLGVPPDEAEAGPALVLLSTSTGLPNGVSVVAGKGVHLLAEGERGAARQCLLVWPEGAALTIEDHLREERHELRRIGGEFSRARVA